MNGNKYQYDPAEMFKEWIQKSGKAQAEFIKNFGSMKTKTLMTAGLAIIASVLLISIELPSAFADEQVSISEEATNRDCNQNDSCYSKSGIIINLGQTVTWLNEDYAIHSVKSGSQDTGVNGIFASDIIMPGDSFSHTFIHSGMFSYYCPSHPWMYGVVYVK